MSHEMTRERSAADFLPSMWRESKVIASWPVVIVRLILGMKKSSESLIVVVKFTARFMGAVSDCMKS